jgi:hypothetical protein
MAKYDYLWLRLGDSAEYQEFGQDLSAFVDELFEHRIDPDDISWLKCPRNPEAYTKKHKLHYLPPAGFHTPDYDGNNYVSLFWSDKTGEGPWQPVTRAEQREIVRLLRRVTDQHNMSRVIEGLEVQIEYHNGEIAKLQTKVKEAKARLRGR